MIGRRRFLGMGIGASLMSRNVMSASASGSVLGGRAGGMRRSMSEHERAFACTPLLHLLGRPRSWSLVRDGFHPISPDRVLVLSERDLRPDRDRSDRRTCDSGKVLDRLRKRRYGHDWARVSDEQLRLIVRATSALACYYESPEHWETWAVAMAARESLGSTGIGRHVAVPHQFQTAANVRTVNPPNDWWLWILPDGVDWQALDDLPVHAIFTHVYARPWQHEPGFTLSVLEILSDCLRSMTADSPQAMVALSRMAPEDAARFVNRQVASAFQSR